MEDFRVIGSVVFSIAVVGVIFMAVTVGLDWLFRHPFVSYPLVAGSIALTWWLIARMRRRTRV